ncbi:MAG: hypothetical protein IRZ11_06385 [Clostridia bacterium]|nr:hypothetical protein [Clostridia bacterium]
MARSLRLFVLEPDDDRRQAIAELVRRSPAFALAGAAGRLEEALAAWPREGCDAALVADAVVYAAPDAVSALARRGATAVVVGLAADQEALRRAMTAGARDFLVWPFSASALAEALADLGAADDEAAGPVVVTSAAGGVGKSLIALNLAALAGRRAEEPAALVDMDLDGGCQALYAGVAPQAHLGDLLRLGRAVDDDALRSAAARVPGVPISLFASPGEPGTWAATDGDDLAGWLDRFQFAFARVVVDLPDVWDERALAVVRRARRTVLVAAAELPSLARTARLVRRLREEAGLGQDRVTVVCNRVHPLMMLNPKAIQEALGLPTIQVPFDELAARSVASAQPLGGRRSPCPFLRAVESIHDAVWPGSGPTAERVSLARELRSLGADLASGAGPAPIPHL